jgi:hypothetical protein
MTLQAATSKPMNAAQKAWATRRARAAALASTAKSLPGQAIADQIAKALPPIAKAPEPERPVIVHYSGNHEFAHVRVKVEPPLEPVEEFQPVNLWVDDPVVGCGFRMFVVLAMSKTKVKLFYHPSLDTTTISREVFDRRHMPVGPRRCSRDGMVAHIRKRIALADRINADAAREVMTDGGADAQRALELIEEGRRA